MMFHRMRNFLFSTLRGRLILSVAAVHAMMMALFIIDLTGRQRAMLLEHQAEDSTALALSLATSAAGWIKADDISGLQELVENQNRYPELLFAMLVDEYGRILAHTDKSKRGLYLHDLPGDIRQAMLSRTPALVDVVVPSRLGVEHVGWARVGIGQKAAGRKLAEITLMGILYAAGAILIGSLIAWRMGYRITKRLYAVQETIKTVKTGNRAARSSLAGSDEAAFLASEFNAMLDILDEQDAVIINSEEKYRVLFEGASDAVFIHEIKDDGMPGPFREANELACRRLGYSREELAAISPMELDDHEYRDRIPQIMERLFKDGRAVFETAHITKDGRSIPVEVSSRVVEIRGERVLISIARDITERKQAARQLESQHALLSAILNSFRDIIIFSVDRNYCYTTFNQKHREEMKKVWNVDIAIGMNLLECMTIPELRDAAQQSMDRALQGEAFSEEQHQPVPDIYYEFIWNPVVQQGMIAGATVFIRDITERKQAELALVASRAALSTREAALNESQRLAHIGSWDWDAVHDTIWWSDEYYRIYGLDPDKPTPNYLEHLKAYIPESAERLDVVVKRAMETGEPYELDLELASPTPGTRWIVARGEAKRDSNGKIWGLRGTAQNITERKLAEQAIHRAKEELEQRVIDRTAELSKKSSQLLDSRQALLNLVDDLNNKTVELKQANSKLQELDQLKSMFIASMSHELRTPLNSIIGFSSILVDEWLGPLNEEQKINLATIASAGKHLLSLINDVIDVSKIEAGKLEISIEDFDLFDLLTEAANLFDRDIRNKGIEFVFEPLQFEVRTDRRRLYQCLINLLSNAVKFTDWGVIRMTAHRIPAGTTDGRTAGEVIEIAVSDTGLGIKEEDIPKLFGAFIRLLPPAHTSIKGTGLGLYLTRKIVREVLGGEIRVESIFGKGSCFTIRIPARWQERRGNEEGSGD